MQYHYLRLVIIGLLTALFVLFLFLEGWHAAWPFLVGAVVLLMIYLLFGTTRLAFHALLRGKMDRAERLIRQTTFPELLVKPNKAQYFFVKGLIHLQHKELEVAETDIKRALSIGLAKKREKALAQLNLAHIYFVQNQPKESRVALSSAQRLGKDDLLLRERLKELEQALDRKFPSPTS